MSYDEARTGSQDRRTLVIDMMSPLGFLPSQETWPSLEDEMDTYQSQFSKIRGWWNTLKPDAPHQHVGGTPSFAYFRGTTHHKTGVLGRYTVFHCACQNLHPMRAPRSP